MNTEEPNSVDKGAHRRSAPAPVKRCVAGAEKDREPDASRAHLLSGLQKQAKEAGSLDYEPASFFLAYRNL